MKSAPKPNIRVPTALKQYTLNDQIGFGAFSEVYKATDTISGERYAVKILPKAALIDAKDQERFQREVNAMAFLKHPNVVSLKDFLWDDDNFYLVMDLCEGRELLNYLQKNKKCDEPMAALIMKQVLHAVAYCHSFGVAHRDLKPENILFTVFPTVKVSDFGLCGYIRESSLMESFCGSACYCAPECLSKVNYDGRFADVWSLGVILFYMVTGQQPWSISNSSLMIRQIMKANYNLPKTLSDECRNLIEAMLKVNPQDRITMEEILKHPWLDCAGDKVELKMPEKQEVTLEELSEMSAKDSRKSSAADFGIVSPFERNGRVEHTDELSSAMFKSSSVAQMDKVHVRLTRGKRKTFGAGGFALGRQRSAHSLVLGSKQKHEVPVPDGFWTEAEDRILIDFIEKNGKNWAALASKLPNRTPTQIQARWEKCLNPTLVKGPFTAEEDKLICKFVKKHGPHSWPRISKLIPERSPKQCRERWFNHLSPDVIKTMWTPEEDQIIFDNYMQVGGKWSMIAKLLPGRTDNAVKNRWHSSLSKRIRSDPVLGDTLLPDPRKRNRRPRPPPIVAKSEELEETALLLQLDLSNVLPRLTPTSAGGFCGEFSPLCAMKIVSPTGITDDFPGTDELINHPLESFECNFEM